MSNIAQKSRTRWAQTQRWLRGDMLSTQTLIMIGLMATAFISGLNHHTFSVVLPSIRHDFSLDADIVSWVTMANTLSLIIFMPLYGRLGDKLGKRRLLLLGVMLFIVGTAIIIVSINLAWLMIGRIVQGMGTAGFTPLSIAIISQRFAPEDRGQLMGTWNSAVPLTGFTVPFLGGLLVDAFGWRGMYPLMLVCGIIALWLVYKNVPGRTATTDSETSLTATDVAIADNDTGLFLRQFDWIGVVLLSSATIVLLLYTSSRAITGVPALQDWRLLGLCFLLFAGLIVWERRRETQWVAEEYIAETQPYINLNLFRNRNFTLTCISAGLRMSLMTSAAFVIPLYLNEIHGLKASTIGIAIALQTAMLFLVSRAGGQLADRWGSRRPVLLSMVGMVGMLAFQAMLPASAPLWLTFVAVMGHGLFIGLSLGPLHRSAMQGVSDEESGSAAGLYSLIRFSGIVLGTAVAGVFLQQGLSQATTQGAEPVVAYQVVFWGYAGVALLNLVISWWLKD
ncbi:MAG: MFS transporter [Chloroflexota bacterium]